MMLRRNIIILALILFAFSIPLMAQNDIAEAIKTDNVAVVQQKIGTGAGQIPLNGKDGIVPLLLAVQHNALQTTRRLLELGADKEAKTRGGSTPLSLAAYYGNVDIVDALITAGAALGTKSPNGYQPLDWALENRHWNVVSRLFFAWGMQEAFGAEEKEALKAIRSGESTKLQHKKGFTSFPLLLAIVKNDTSLVEVLLKAGFDPNQQNAAGYAPLPTAARLGNVSVVKVLLQYKADPNIGGTKGNDVAGALNQAARGLNADAGAELIKNGAEVNRGNAKGVTPLYICGRIDSKDGAFTEMLLKNGASLRLKADDGYDAFDAAMESRNRLYTQIAMKEFFLQSARNEHERELFSSILKNTSTIPKQIAPESSVLLLNYAVVKGDSALFAKVLPIVDNLNRKNISGHYPLPLAASWGEKDMLRHLLKNGADVNIQNENRYNTSALMESTRDANFEIAQELIQHKASVNLKDVHSDHALNWATFYGRKRIVELLLTNGADFTQRGQQTSDNALDIAQRMNFQEIAQILQTAGARASK